jgi:hypothetical protein
MKWERKEVKACCLIEMVYSLVRSRCFGDDLVLSIVNDPDLDSFNSTLECKSCELRDPGACVERGQKNLAYAYFVSGRDIAADYSAAMLEVLGMVVTPGSKGSVNPFCDGATTPPSAKEIIRGLPRDPDEPVRLTSFLKRIFIPAPREERERFGVTGMYYYTGLSVVSILNMLAYVKKPDPGLALMSSRVIGACAEAVVYGRVFFEEILRCGRVAMTEHGVEHSLVNSAGAVLKWPEYETFREIFLKRSYGRKIFEPVTEVETYEEFSSVVDRIFEFSILSD